MKLISCSISDIAEKRGYSDNFGILMKFKEANMECAEVDEFTQKRAASCSSSLNQSIKRYKFNDIKAISRDGKVYLVRKELLEKAGFKNARSK